MKKITFALVMSTFIFWFTGCNDDSLLSLDDTFVKAGNDNPNIDPTNANWFDLTGNLCDNQYHYGDQSPGTPLELWTGVGNQNAGTKVGEVTFNGDCVKIDLTKGEGVHDATAIHMEFVTDYDDFHTNRPGNPIVGKFEYNYDNSNKLNSIRIAPSVYEICGVSNLDEGNWGAIHVDAIPAQSASGISSVEDCKNILPKDPVKLTITDYPSIGDPSYFKFQIAEGGILSDYNGGMYEGWCIDSDNGIGLNQEYMADIYCSLGDDIPNGIIEYPENLDIVNYLLNNYKTGDWIQPIDGECGSPIGDSEQLLYGDIQYAIWQLLDDGPGTFEPSLNEWSQERVDALLCDANTNGDNFTPSCGDNIVFIAVPEGERQILIGMIPLSCPGTGSGTAWADGKYGIGFLGRSWATYFGVGCNN